MSSAKFEIKFPCGYEIKIEQNIGWLTEAFSSISFNKHTIPTECPIHGKKCLKGDK